VGVFTRVKVSNPIKQRGAAAFRLTVELVDGILRYKRYRKLQVRDSLLELLKRNRRILVFNLLCQRFEPVVEQPQQVPFRV
jgi:hypothetical protein